VKTRAKKASVTIATLAVVAMLTACKKAPEPEPAAQMPAPPASSVERPRERSEGAGGRASLPDVVITWEDPPGWTKSPPKNAMRKANYLVPRAAGDSEDGELVVFYFGADQGGALEDNVSRWVKQFSDIGAGDVKRADRRVSGLRQHTVEIEKGTYASGMPGGPQTPKTGYGMLGAIVEAPTGPYFFKLTGPAATVSAAKPAFFKLLDSVKPAT
jgi:hypothetical protein